MGIILFSSCKRTVQNNPPDIQEQTISVSIDSLISRKFGTTSFKKLNLSGTAVGLQNFALCYEPKMRKGGGIILALVSISKDSINVLFSSSLLDGSAENTSIAVINTPNDTTNKYIYFDTGDYLLGSSGGEMYIYLISINSPSLVMAHLIVESSAPPKLFIDSNCPTAITKYLVNKSRADFPNLTRIKKDQSID